MMNLPTEYKTKRLLLRKPVVEDAGKIFDAYGQDKDVCRYMTWEPHQRAETLRSWLENIINVFGKSNASYVLCPVDGIESVIGMVDARIEGHKAMMGYVLARKHWGNGLMTEAVTGLIELLFREKDIFRVWAVCDVENVASSKVMEKSGMSYEGTLKKFILHPNVSKEPRDVFCYSKIR